MKSIVFRMGVKLAESVKMNFSTAPRTKNTLKYFLVTKHEVRMELCGLRLGGLGTFLVESEIVHFIFP